MKGKNKSKPISELSEEMDKKSGKRKAGNKPAAVAEVTEEEKHLEEFLFGKDIIADFGKATKKQRTHLKHNIRDAAKAADEDEDAEALDIEINFAIDKTPAASSASVVLKESSHTELSPSTAEEAQVAAWFDEDDANVEVDLNQTSRLKKLKTVDQFNSDMATATVSGTELSDRLRRRFTESGGVAKWAAIPKQQQQQQQQLSVASLAGIDAGDYAILGHAGDTMIASTNFTGAGATGGAKFSRSRAEDASLHPLPNGIISTKRLVNANITDPSKGNINSLDFHSSGELLMVGGEDRQLKFFKVDGERNEKQLSVLLKDMRLSEAKFVGDSSNVVIAGRKPYFYSYDTVYGKLSKVLAPNPRETRSLEHMTLSPMGKSIAFRGVGGYLHICDGFRHQWTHTLKMNTAARAMCFLDETHLATSGLDADVYIWDLRMSGRCIARFPHEDGSCTSSMAAFVPSSSVVATATTTTAARATSYTGYQLTQSFLALGTESGVVSLFGEEQQNCFTSATAENEFTKWDYNSREVDLPQQQLAAATTTTAGAALQQPRPMKTIFNLTTKITSTVFHPSGQLLAMASGEKRNQLKLVHVPTATVFANWPTDNTPLNRITSMAFSRATRGGLFAIGNNQGRVLLYRLEHFGAA